MDFGQVVLLRSDGSEGQALNIRKDVSFGRDHPAHIRIKSKSVAPQHAKIHIDVNGLCFLQYLNSSCRPRINGVRMSSKRLDSHSIHPYSVQLHHLDVISIAGRSFRFKSKSGLVVDNYPNDHMDLNDNHTGEDIVSDRRYHTEKEVDSMSLDSRGSRRSINSQVSTCSTFSVNTIGSMNAGGGTSSDKAVAWIRLLKKDGSEGTPYPVIKELTFGR